MPDARVDAMPPSEASAPGSIGKKSPVSCRYAFNCLRVTPGSTRASRSLALTSRIRFICDRSMQTPPCVASTCPSTDVPMPNGIIGVRWRAHRLTIATTSSVVCGNTTASGGVTGYDETSVP